MEGINLIIDTEVFLDCSRKRERERERENREEYQLSKKFWEMLLKGSLRNKPITIFLTRSIQREYIGRYNQREKFDQRPEKLNMIRSRASGKLKGNLEFKLLQESAIKYGEEEFKKEFELGHKAKLVALAYSLAEKGREVLIVTRDLNFRAKIQEIAKSSGFEIEVPEFPDLLLRLQLL